MQQARQQAAEFRFKFGYEMPVRPLHADTAMAWPAGLDERAEQCLEPTDSMLGNIDPVPALIA